MTDTEPASTAASTRDAAEQPAASAQRRGRLGLSRGERVLAAATAAAILLSGANALVQMVRVLLQC